MKKRGKLFALLVSMILIVATMTVSVQADEANENVREARKGVLQIRLYYEDKETGGMYIGGGSGFLINEETLLTANHVIDIADDDTQMEYAKRLFGDDFDVSKVQIKVVVMHDLVLTAKVVNSSDELDFAILEMEQPIYDRAPLTLNTTKNLAETQEVYALGFPSAVAGYQNVNTYTSDDVTISDGRVTKTTQSGSVNYVQHSVQMTAGHSGGPLIGSDGTVYGINRGVMLNASINVDSNGDLNVVYNETPYDLAIGIDQVRAALNALGIQYDGVDEGAATTPTEETTTEDKEEVTTARPTEAPTTRAPIPTTPSSNTADEKGDSNDSNIVMIITIAAVAVVVIVVIIILIITLGNSKKKAAQIPNVRPSSPGMGGPVPPTAGGPIPPQPASNRGMTPPPAPGFGNDGETTVLGAQAGGRTIVRVKNGESIQITRPEFIIGKERRRVDYCVADNNSVSRIHAKLVTRGGDIFVMDMNATNGTFVNGVKLSPNQELKLSVGDRFKLADEEFQLRS